MLDEYEQAGRILVFVKIVAKAAFFGTRGLDDSNQIPAQFIFLAAFGSKSDDDE